MLRQCFQGFLLYTNYQEKEVLREWNHRAFQKVYNMLSCQQCPTSCNNCQNYTALCLACSSSSLRLNPPDCMDCPENTYIDGYICTQCDSSCQTCNSAKCLTCLSQQYINTFGKCVSCPNHCLTCDIDRCYTCAGNCQQCNLQGCLKCISDSYYLSGSECHQCSEYCVKCDSLQCLTCIGSRIPINNKCDCQSSCLTCDSTQCLTCISSDYRIQNRTCQYCPQECIICDEQGICYTKPQHCQLGIFISEHIIQCTQCQSNYQLLNNNCIIAPSCSSKCLECANQPQNCTVCRFQEVSQTECNICESQSGLYSNYENNICYAICGDGIISMNEECDDGNSNPFDGCSHCSIQPGYYCQGIICNLIVYPVPSIQQNITNDSVQIQLIIHPFSLHQHTSKTEQSFKINQQSSQQNFNNHEWWWLQLFDQNFIDLNYYHSPPPLINNDGFTSSTIINQTPLLNVLILGFGIRCLAQIIIYVDNKMECQPNLRYLKNHIKIMKFIYNCRQQIVKSCNQIINSWVWSGLIRIFISSAYDISFMICLGINGLQFQNSAPIIRAEFCLTIAFTLTYFIITLLISIIAGHERRILREKYYPVQEGLRYNNKISKQHITFVLINKIVFMVFLVLLYNEPMFQILNIIFIQICYLLYLMFIDPISDNKEKIKQIICALFTLIAEFQLAILVIHDHHALFVYENRRIFGWICVFSLVIIIISQLILDVWQQISYYYKRYPGFRRCFGTLRNIQQNGRDIRPHQ